MAGTYYLERAVGPQVAARMLLTGEVIDGRHAERIGLVCETTGTCGVQGAAGSAVVLTRDGGRRHGGGVRGAYGGDC